MTAPCPECPECVTLLVRAERAERERIVCGACALPRDHYRCLLRACQSLHRRWREAERRAETAEARRA